MTLNHQPFLDEILHAPKDDNPRLIYADWLTEHGDPRGEFIRIQCRRAELSFESAEYWELRQQEQAMLAVHRQEWAGELPDLVYHYQFHRGFPSRIRIFSEPFLKNADKIFALTPIEDVVFDFARDRQLAPLLASEKLNQLDSLVIGNSWGKRDLEMVWDSGHVPHLRKLALRSSIGGSGTKFANGGKELENLESLSLAGVHGKTWVQLLGNTNLKNLKSLGIVGPFLRNPGKDLYKSALWKQLESLSIDFAGHRRANVSEFLESAPFANLKSLILSGRTPPTRELFAKNQLANLAALTLETRLSRADVNWLASEELLPSLRVLCCDDRTFTNGSLQELFQSKIGKQLFAVYEGQGVDSDVIGRLSNLKYLQFPAYLIPRKEKIDEACGTNFSQNCDVDHWFGLVENWNPYFA